MNLSVSWGYLFIKESLAINKAVIEFCKVNENVLFLKYSNPIEPNVLNHFSSNIIKLYIYIYDMEEKQIVFLLAVERKFI